MKDEGEIERLLAQLPVPSLREGPHREQLGAQLLAPPHHSERKGEDPMKVSRAFRTTRMIKLAAGLLIAAMLVATGWAAEKVAEKVYESFAKGDQYVELERSEEPPVTLPDGTVMSSSSVTGTYLPADAPPEAVEKAKKDHEEMKQLIAQKKYELVKTFEQPGSVKQYVYRFTLADGSPHKLNFSIPLENVTSWEDYCQKSREHKRQRKEKIFKAFAADRFRLLDIDPISVHVCRDADSDERYLVQRFRRRDGEDEALIRPEGTNGTEHKTSWEDHLEAIRQGKRVLVDLQITKGYVCANAPASRQARTREQSPFGTRCPSAERRRGRCDAGDLATPGRTTQAPSGTRSRRPALAWSPASRCPRA